MAKKKVGGKRTSPRKLKKRIKNKVAATARNSGRFSDSSYINKKAKPRVKKRPLSDKEGTPVEKKRVSFSSKLVSSSDAARISSVDDSTISTEPSPGLKPILKKREGANSKKINSTKKRRIVQEKDTDDNSKKIKLDNQDDEKESKEEDEKISPKTGGSTPKKGKFSADKKKTILYVSKEAQQKLKSLSTRKERREYARELRAERKPYFELALKAKRLWEKIRNKRNASAKERKEIIDELYGLVEGKVKQLIFAHDTVRVIQCLMALKNNEEIRTKIFEEVKDHILLMSMSKYAKFFVIKMLKYGTPAQREHVTSAFYGKITSLAKHSSAAEVVEYAYNEYANALQRARMISEFYSSEYALFKVDEVITLKSIFENEPSRKEGILKNMKEHIMGFTTKPVLRHSIIHRLISEFFDYCSDADRKDVIDALKERVIEMVHTRDGTKAAMHCVWHGSAKERKIIVRTMKGLVTKICSEEYGHLLLLAIFDCVDDTITVQKIILKEIENYLADVIANKYGLRVLHYLLKPRCGMHFVKQTCELLAIGDQNTVSKKDKNQRHTELLSSISPALLAYLAHNVRDLLFNAHTALLVASILENATGDKSDAFKALCTEVLKEEFVPCNIENLHAVEQKQSHYVLRHLIKNDKVLFAKGEKTLSETIVTELPSTQLLSWMSCNKGAFILLFMYETEIPSVQKAIVDIVKSPGGKKKLKQYTFAAAKVLSQKIS